MSVYVFLKFVLTLNFIVGFGTSAHFDGPHFNYMHFQLVTWHGIEFFRKIIVLILFSPIIEAKFSLVNYM